MHLLVSAELAWGRGIRRSAVHLYRAAARRANQQGYPHHEAIALDLLAQRLLHSNRRLEAAAAYREAQNRYADGGAVARCAVLQARWKDLAR